MMVAGEIFHTSGELLTSINAVASCLALTHVIGGTGHNGNVIFCQRCPLRIHIGTRTINRQSFCFLASVAVTGFVIAVALHTCRLLTVHLTEASPHLRLTALLRARRHRVFSNCLGMSSPTCGFMLLFAWRVFISSWWERCPTCHSASL
jgi:hypothetical protein